MQSNCATGEELIGRICPWQLEPCQGARLGRLLAGRMRGRFRRHRQSDESRFAPAGSAGLSGLLPREVFRSAGHGRCRAFSGGQRRAGPAAARARGGGGGPAQPAFPEIHHRLRCPGSQRDGLGGCAAAEASLLGRCDWARWEQQWSPLWGRAGGRPAARQCLLVGCGWPAGWLAPLGSPRSAAWPCFMLAAAATIRQQQQQQGWGLPPAPTAPPPSPPSPPSPSPFPLLPPFARGLPCPAPPPALALFLPPYQFY